MSKAEQERALAAAKWLEERFPIPDYLTPEGTRQVLPWIADRIGGVLPDGGKVLDFGAGAGDIAAFLTRLGYDCSACDGLLDPWHLRDDNRRKILDFSREIGVDFRLLEEGQAFPWQGPQFDLVMAHHVLEHIPGSPRPVVDLMASLIRPGGYLFVAVPNAGNLRKRLAVLRGRTNYPAFYHVYWQKGTWRGHVREYVRDDLEQMIRYAGLDRVEVDSYHGMLGALPRRARPIYKAVTTVVPGGRDSWYLLARKPPDWTPPTGIRPDDPNAAKLARVEY